MVAMRMMQVALDAVIDVIAVRYRLMAAAGVVDMTRLMAATAVVRGAALGVAGGHIDDVLVDMTVMGMVEMTIVQVVDVTAVPYGRMTAARPVLMRVIGVGGSGAGSHFQSSFPCPGTVDTAVRLSAACSIALRTSGNTCSSASA